jgi:hypothetical protein
MPNHPPETGRLPFVSSQYRAMTSAIREELRARYQPPDQLSHGLGGYWDGSDVLTPAVLVAGRVGRMRCGLLTTNRGVSLKFRFTS